MTTDGLAPVEAQVLFADCRAPGPISASIGWKVKDVLEAPGSAPVGRTLLQAVDAVGQGYVPDVEVARADRSAGTTPVLKQVRLEGDVMLLAQFADAGLDRTGRASHTMHGLLHSAPLQDATGRFLRPAELFDSPMWLRPVGNDGIEAATVKESRFDLPVGPVGLGEVIGDAFLTDLDTPERVALLPVVLEAFRAALEDEASTVLVVSTPLESASWLALLVNLIDPVSAGRLRFSTREDLLSTSTVDGWDYHLTAVVRPAAARGGRDPLAAFGSRFLVLDTSRPLTENPDGSWTLADGSTLRRSAWTELAETVLMSPVVTGGVRNRLDELAVAVTGLDTSPTWGLPVAALLAGADLPDTEHAVRWIYEHWPTGADLAPDLVDELVPALSRAIGASETLPTELSGSLADGVPDFLADAVIAGAVRQALAGLRAGVTPPVLRRPLTPSAADALDAELPGLLGWVDAEPFAERFATLQRVLRFGESAGLHPAALRSALGPSIDAMVRAIVDPGFDPYALGLPPVSAALWREVLADRVSDALAVHDPGVEVSPATHEWLTPSLEAIDQPETAARRRDLHLSGYGNRRAAWHGGSADPWLSAAFAVGMMHVNTFRYGLPAEVAVRRALDRAFNGLPVPADVAERLLAAVGDDSGARLSVAGAALADGGFTTEQRLLANKLRADLQVGDPLRPEAAPVFLALYYHLLVRGTPADAVVANTRAAAEAIAHRLPQLGRPELQNAARAMVLTWGLRLPVYAVRDPEGPAGAYASVIAALDAAGPDTHALDHALSWLLANGSDLTPVVAQLVVRTGLAVEDKDIHADPYVRYLRRVDDRGDPLLLREGLGDWFARQDKGALDRVTAAVDAVIDDLSRRGWRHRLGDLESDRDNYVGSLQARSVLGRRRQRR